MATTPILADLRKEYSLQKLELNKTAADPVAQFQKWMQEAMEAKVPEPSAMHLCTVSADGRPSGRIVLLKGVNEEGFTFFTNYSSRKGQEIAQNSWVSLTFFWPELERQVRIEGLASQVAPEVSDEYFQSRPRNSRIGALASPQSQILPDRHLLEEKVQQLTQQYGETSVIPRPENWGGYCVHPVAVEFWQGRPSRLHDRIQYVKADSGTWQKQRLAP